jgi:hypothetical protein
MPAQLGLFRRPILPFQVETGKTAPRMAAHAFLIGSLAIILTRLPLTAEIGSLKCGGFDPNERHDYVACFDELGPVLSNGNRRANWCGRRNRRRRFRLLVYLAEGTASHCLGIWLRDDLPVIPLQNRNAVVRPRRRDFWLSRGLRFSIRHSDHQALL